MGTPVISTSKGAEGLDSIPEEHLLIADSPAAFADQVIRVLKDDDLHAKLSAKALQFVKDKYDREIVMPRFLDLVESAASQGLDPGSAEMDIDINLRFFTFSGKYP